MNKHKRRAHIQNTYQKEADRVRKAVGTSGEQHAQTFLSGRGYRILKTNVNTHWGEIDIVAWDQTTRTTVFVEVKAKSSERFGTPEEQFHWTKRRRLRRAIEWYSLTHHIDRYRVDVVTIQMNKPSRELRHYLSVEL